MSKLSKQSALLVMGAAAGAAAATWLNQRRLSVVNTGSDELIEPESAELPVGRSADPAVDDALSRTRLPQDDTTGGTLLDAPKPRRVEPSRDFSLDEIWNAPGLDEEEERGEGYDAVNPESLGAVWLERATQTTHDPRRDASDLSDLPELDGLTISEATLASSGFGEEDEAADSRREEDDEEEDHEPASRQEEESAESRQDPR